MLALWALFLERWLFGAWTACARAAHARGFRTMLRATSYFAAGAIAASEMTLLSEREKRAHRTWWFQPLAPAGGCSLSHAPSRLRVVHGLARPLISRRPRCGGEYGLALMALLISQFRWTGWAAPTRGSWGDARVHGSDHGCNGESSAVPRHGQRRAFQDQIFACACAEFLQYRAALAGASVALAPY